MKKILQKTSWERYKKSSEGQETIALFNNICTPECTSKDMFEVIKRFNPFFTHNWGKKEDNWAIKGFEFFDKIVNEDIPRDEIEWKDFDYEEYYMWLTLGLVTDNEDADLYEVPQVNFKRMLSDSMLLSIVLYKYMPEYYIPNLYAMQFVYFQRFVKKYDLVLPEIPHRSDYRKRWLYYLDMCNVINEFAHLNEFQDSGELCAFLFDYEFTNIKDEMDAEFAKPMPTVPEQAWILVGN